MSKCNYGKSTLSPKVKQNMKREAEKNERKYKSTCEHSDIQSLMKSRKK